MLIVWTRSKEQMAKRVAWPHQHLHPIHPRSCRRVKLTDVLDGRWEQTEKAQREAQHDGFCVHTHSNTCWQRAPPSVTLNPSFGGLAHLTSVVRHSNAKGFSYIGSRVIPTPGVETQAVVFHGQPGVSWRWKMCQLLPLVVFQHKANVQTNLWLGE